jgi:hypothetical protein
MAQSIWGEMRFLPPLPLLVLSSLSSMNLLLVFPVAFSFYPLVSELGDSWLLSIDS